MLAPNATSTVVTLSDPPWLSDPGTDANRSSDLRAAASAATGAGARTSSCSLLIG